MNRRLLFLFIALTFLTRTMQAQERVITGRVLIEGENIGIAFATLGVKNKALGTVTDEHGNFKLKLTSNEIDEVDTLTVSALGFAPVLVPAEAIQKEELTIHMTKQAIDLPMVTVRGTKIKEVTYGRTSSGGLTYVNFFSAKDQVEDALSREWGKVIKVNESVRLKSFHFFVNRNDFAVVKFRFRLYEVNGKRPVPITLPEDIIFDVTRQKGWVDLDLMKYNLFLDGKEKLGIAIQWLSSAGRNSNSKFFVLPASPDPLSQGMYRQKGEDNWTFPKANISFYVKADRYK